MFYFLDRLCFHIDFENEGKNAERLARNFESNGQVGVPKIIWVITLFSIFTFMVVNKVQ